MGHAAPDSGIRRNPSAAVSRHIALALYYAAVVVALLVLYGSGNFSAPPFVYQGF